MKLLAIETATEACSAALYIDGEVDQRYQVAPREHGKLILGMLDDLMASSQTSVSQLDAIAFGRGPGSFIGVRIAAGVTQGIAFAADLPVVPVSTLATIAQGTTYTHVLVAIDARMGEIYWGQYSRASGSGIIEEHASESLLSPEDVVIPESQYDWVGVGSGWESYRDVLNRRLVSVDKIDENHYPAAKNTAILACHQFNLGEIVSPEQAIPVYLRDRVAEKPKAS